MRFEMLGGRHIDDEGVTRVFRKGKRTVVESDKPLDEMFKNSFRRLDEPSKVSKDHRDTPDHSGGQVMDDLLAKKKKKVKGRDELDDLTPKKANRPRAVGKKQELDQKRSILREDEAEEDERAEMEEDEDLDDLEEDEEAPEEEEALEEEEPEPEEEVEEEPEPEPVKKVKKKSGMKKKKAK